MLKNIPHDVEIYIYTFLILPLDICKLKCISKYYSAIIDNIPYIKEKKLFINRTHMLLEDTDCYDANLADKWEYYHKWNWPESIEEEKDYTPLWKKGQYVDVLDKIQVWGSGIILEQRFYEYPHNKKIERQYYIQFLGWNLHFNEWVTGDKITFFGSKTINPRNKIESLNNIHKRWVLYKKDHETWSLEILKIKENKKNKKVVELTGFRDNIFKIETITPENINKIRSVTNGTVLFSIKNKNFIENRILKY